MSAAAPRDVGSGSTPVELSCVGVPRATAVTVWVLSTALVAWLRTVIV